MEKRLNQTGRRGVNVFSKVQKLRVLGMALALSFSAESTAVISDEPPQPATVNIGAPPITWQVKMGGRITLPIDDPEVSYDIGKQLPLFELKDESYVAIIASESGQLRLCEFPRFSPGLNESTAWISEDKLLLFGRRTASIQGSFTFAPDEVVPLLKENKDAYTVEVQRRGYRIALEVPKKTQGVVLVPVRGEGRASAVAPRAVRVAAPPPVVPAATTVTPPAPPPAAVASTPAGTEPSPELALAKIKEEMLQELLAKLETARKQRDLEQAAKDAEQRAAAPVPVVPAPEVPAEVEKPDPVAATAPVAPVEPPAPVDPAQLLLAYLRERIVTIVLGSMVVLLTLLLVIRLRSHSSRGPAAARGEMRMAGQPAPVASEVFTFSSVGQSITPESIQSQLDGHGDLSGTLGGCILPQVVQFFCAARESGLMIVRQDNGFIEELVFKEGQIIDARSGRLNPREAARAILRQREGKFFFRRGNLSNQTPAINDETMALLLEATKLHDEVGGGRHG